MLGDQLRRLLGRLRRILRMDRRQSHDESRQVLHLSESIMDHGRMGQSQYERPMEYAMVEVKELAFRFREREQTIESALLLLKDMGRAELYDGHGRWRLRLTDAHRSSGEDKDKGDAA